MAKRKASSLAAEQPAAPGIAASNRLADLAGRISDGERRLRPFSDFALQCAKTGKFAGLRRAASAAEKTRKFTGFGAPYWSRKLLEFKQFPRRRGARGANGPSIQPSANLRKVGDLAWHGSAGRRAPVGGLPVYRSATLPRGAFQ